ncbi:Exostosin-2 [Amphibalanus amphitrite]|uniref:Exostosin-2 n=1 Tax=Amphibalanus amphitrite TaxID=1232801 RepID=A0A6A4WVX1_AMPAM|nr:Exostosin-2 [Amphibalanus amphitrite]
MASSRGLPTWQRSCAGGRRQRWPARHYFALAALTLIALAVLELALLVRGLLQPATPAALQLTADTLSAAPLVRLTASDPPPAAGQANCSHFTCLNVYRCGGPHRRRVAVYVYPYARYAGETRHSELAPLSREYYDMLRAVRESEFFTEDPEEACLLLPAVDTLSNRISEEMTVRALASLPHWNDGENHLVFSVWPASGQERLGRALLAGAGLSSLVHRHKYDVSLPTPSEREDEPDDTHTPAPERPRRYLLVSAQPDLHVEYRRSLRSLAAADVSGRTLVLERCAEDTDQLCDAEGRQHDYWETMQSAEFCILLRRAQLGPPELLDALRVGCVPVVAADLYVLPFSEVIDWTRVGLHVYEQDLTELAGIIKEMSPQRRSEMRAQARWVYEQYFSTFGQMALTTLQIVNDRILAHAARSYEQWNDPPHMVSPGYPLTVPYTSPRMQGFTAVILTYDRLDSLYQIIEKVALAPSLTKVLVVWNNQKKEPPPASLWPTITKPLKVIRTAANRLSNRFYPYAEIETECVLALDDDITMLTVDELEFGYQVWREYPDRIVGFPSRNHVWNNVTGRWGYDSEWTSELSMVLTGAAFYHKYWNYRYTSSLPAGVKDWVDDNMNCEDIAMNFLVANITGKAPIKVAARKKFKCTSADCSGGDLSANQSHFIERSVCIQQFVSAFGGMPLRSAQFRADPVLYRDDFPAKLKRYNDVGSL